MRPSFNSFQHQGRPQRPQRPQQNNGYPGHNQHNGYHNSVDSSQLGMMNSQMMNNPMMGHMNNPIRMPNMPLHSQLYNDFSNLSQQQQLQQFSMPNINQLLPNLLGNLQFAVANPNLLGHPLPLAQPNFFQPPLDHSAFTSQPQLNSFNPHSYPSHQNHALQPQGFSEPRPQSQPVGVVNNTHNSSSKGNDFRNKFTKHPKFKGNGQGFQRPQLHQADNGKRKFGFKKDHMGKGKYNKMASGFDGSNADNVAKEKTRSCGVVYTPKEIQQWREARRKNFPTKLTVEQKVKKNASDCILDEEAKLRREQLRGVLARQAELGVEVAEVPSHYLSNTTNEHVNGDQRDNRHLLNSKQAQYNNDKKGRFQNNRHNKRRHGEKNKFNKKPRFQNQNLSQESSTITREPTLLEKLLSADIKRDNYRLLQVFRFMAMNSFFEETTEQPLKLPLVMVEETGCEHDRKDPSDLCVDTITDGLCDDHDDDNHDVDDVSDDDSSRDEAIDKDDHV